MRLRSEGRASRGDSLFINKGTHVDRDIFDVCRDDRAYEPVFEGPVSGSAVGMTGRPVHSAGGDSSCAAYTWEPRRVQL